MPRIFKTGILNVMFSLAQNYLTRGFWGDEAWTSLISQLPYVQMLKTTAADFHPPGYYTMIELWYKFFPTTEVSTRIVSIIFYFLTLFMVYKLASYVRGHTFGLLSAIAVAVNPIFFTYAFEARNYTMFAFASVGSIYFLIKFSTSSNIKYGVLFILFSTLGIYTHYYMFFTLGAQGLFILLFDRKVLLKMFGVYAVVGILYLPWIPFLVGQLKSVGGDYWIGGIDQRTHYEAVLRILSGEHENAFRFWLFGLSILLIVIGLLQHTRHKSFEKPPLRPFNFAQGFEGRAYILIWFWAVVPFVLATLPGLSVAGFKFPFRSIFFWRYLIPASVPFAMMIVHASQKLVQPLKTLILITVITLSLAIDYLTFVRYPYGFKQVYEQKILPQSASGDKIVTVLPSFAEVLYYRNRFGLDNELIVLSEGLVQFSGKSLLDAYVENGVVTIDDNPTGKYFELRPGPTIAKVKSKSEK